MFKQPEKREVDKTKRKRKTRKSRKKRGSRKKQGTRQTDVKLTTLRKRPGQYPGHGLQVRCKSLYCITCSKEIGSGKQAVEQHLDTQEHKDNLITAAARVRNKQELLTAIDEFKGEVFAEDREEVVGLVAVPIEVQAFRAE